MLVAQGQAGGTTWQARAQLWPHPETMGQALAQQEKWPAKQRNTELASPSPGHPMADRSPAERLRLIYPPGTDTVRVFLTVAGTETESSASRVPSPDGRPPGPTGGGAGRSLEGSLLGVKGGGAGGVPVLVAPVGPDVARVVAAWSDGTSTEAVPVVLGDSPMRWIGLPGKPGVQATSVRLLGAGGAVLATDTQWFH
ncbi:hypothetical protein [Kitasatospora sp. NPDC047058]|uniref:hypothetical protein n=1 Tax=Kitasatospora sp. NPDC047058 TaxID=3155620 RepID=UPI0033E98265